MKYIFPNWRKYLHGDNVKPLFAAQTGLVFALAVIFLNKHASQSLIVTIIFAVLWGLGVIFALICKFPGELACILLSVLSDLIYMDNRLFIPGIVIYLFIARWVYRGWIFQAVLLSVVECYLFINRSPFVHNTYIWPVVTTFLMFGMAILINSANKKIQMVQSQAQEAGVQVRRELALQLHETTAKDLARIAMITQEMSAKGQATQAELDNLVDLALTAAQRIRPMIMNLDNVRNRESITETIDLVQKMLSTRTIDLQTSVPENIDSIAQKQQLLILATAIREGATNVLKYGQSSSKANLEIEKLAGHRLAMTMTNDIAAVFYKGLTGGFGLANLEAQVSSIGGELTYGKIGERWIMHVEMPFSLGVANG